MKVSDVLAELLVVNNVKTVFGYQGGSVTSIIDSISSKTNIKYIQGYNEQGASFAADAYARLSKEGIGVAIASNGPGATNLVTGIANAYCDSIPVIFITGQVHTYAMKNDSQTRQESFQEISILSIVKSISKYAVTIMDKERLPSEVMKAFRIALEGRRGPVLLDIPVDIQNQDMDFNIEDYIDQKATRGIDHNYIDSAVMKKIIDLIRASERPTVLAGGGIRQANATAFLREFVSQYDIPVVTSLHGLDSLPHDDRHFVGLIGPFGNRYANLTIQNADLLIVLGSRIDGRQTGKNRSSFAKRAKIIHVDIDDAELAHYIDEDISIHASVNTFLSLVLSEENDELNHEEWLNQIESWKKLFDDVKENDADAYDLAQEKQPDSAIQNEINCEVEQSQKVAHRFNPNAIIKTIGAHLPENAIVCADVGQNQMWVAQSMRAPHANVRILNSGGLGAMGYSLPACIGAYYANPHAKVVGVMGDGGLQMNIQELEVLDYYQLPISLFIMNNESLGLIRDMHMRYYGGRCVGSEHGFSSPNLRLLSEAYGMNYRRIDKTMSASEIGDEIEESLTDQRPCLTEVLVGIGSRIKPELIGFKGLDEQSPEVRYSIKKEMV